LEEEEEPPNSFVLVSSTSFHFQVRERKKKILSFLPCQLYCFPFPSEGEKKKSYLWKCGSLALEFVIYGDEGNE
jgi:hypothetical protein